MNLFLNSKVYLYIELRFSLILYSFVKICFQIFVVRFSFENLTEMMIYILHMLRRLSVELEIFGAVMILSC